MCDMSEYNSILLPCTVRIAFPCHLYFSIPLPFTRKGHIWFHSSFQQYTVQELWTGCLHFGPKHSLCITLHRNNKWVKDYTGKRCPLPTLHVFKAGVHRFSINVRATWELWMPEQRHDASSILTIHTHTRSHCKKFSCHSDLEPGICAPLV